MISPRSIYIRIADIDELGDMQKNSKIKKELIKRS